MSAPRPKSQSQRCVPNLSEVPTQFDTPLKCWYNLRMLPNLSSESLCVIEDPIGKRVSTAIGFFCVPGRHQLSLFWRVGLRRWQFV